MSCLAAYTLKVGVLKNKFMIKRAIYQKVIRVTKKCTFGTKCIENIAFDDDISVKLIEKKSFLVEKAVIETVFELPHT